MTAFCHGELDWVVFPPFLGSDHYGVMYVFWHFTEMNLLFFIIDVDPNLQQPTTSSPSKEVGAFSSGICHDADGMKNKVLFFFFFPHISSKLIWKQTFGSLTSN